MLTCISKLLDEKLKPIEDKLEPLEQLRKDFTDFKTTCNASLEALSKDVKDLDIETKSIRDDVVANKDEQSRINLLKEYYDKRYNLLIFGIPDPQDYEKKTQSLHLVRTYLREALQYPKWDTLYIRDVHRLPQRKSDVTGVLTRRQREDDTPRPIVIRLCSVLEKSELFQYCENLSEYNSHITKQSERIFINDHLPKKMGEQKKALLAKFKKAKLAKKDAYWSVNTTTADYCLYVEGKRVL